MSQNNIKSEEDKILYRRECSVCGDVRTDLKARPNEPQLCAGCSSNKVGKSDAIEEEFAPPRITMTRENGKSRTLWLRTCSNEECGDSAYISCKPKENAVCQDCARKVGHSMVDKIVKRPKGNKPRKKIIHAKNSGRVSKEAIEKARDINRTHKESINIAKVIPQKLSDEEMIAGYLETHKVESAFVPANWGHYVTPMASSGSSVLS